MTEQERLNELAALYCVWLKKPQEIQDPMLSGFFEQMKDATKKHLHVYAPDRPTYS